jgi:glycosyltransferase involved in cell wall biosynthesis
MIHTPLTWRGGGERQVLRLAIELEKLGHEVEIFVSAVDEEACYPNLLNKVKINVIPHPLPHSLARFKPLYKRVVKNRTKNYDYDFPCMINIGRSIPKGFDVINNHNFPTAWATFFAKKRLKIPVVWMCNEPPFWLWHAEEMELRSKISRIIHWPLCEVFDKVSTKNIDEIVVLSLVAQELVKKSLQ